MKEKIKQVFVSLLRIRPEELKDDVALESGIGVDSTEMVELCIALCKEFKIKIENNEISKSSTLNDIETVIKSKTASTA